MPHWMLIFALWKKYSLADALQSSMIPNRSRIRVTTYDAREIQMHSIYGQDHVHTCTQVIPISSLCLTLSVRLGRISPANDD